MVLRLARPKKMGLSRPVVLINLYGDISVLDGDIFPLGVL